MQPITVQREVEAGVSRRRLTFTTTLSVAAMISAGVAMCRSSATREVPVPLVSPIEVHLPPGPPPAVTVTLAPPPPPPAPPPAPPAPAPPGPRATTPTLFAECVLPPAEGQEASPICSWDTGFPAISDDGERLVTLTAPDDAGRGNPGLFVEILDATSGRTLRTIKVLSPDEIEDEPEATLALQHTIVRRVATVQRVLDDGHYRSLAPLGSSEIPMHAEGDGESVDADGDTLRAEFSGATMRVIDTASPHETVVWTHRFGLPSPGGMDDTDQCSGWTLTALSVWWDPQTRLVLAGESYQTGGCLCGDVSRTQIARMPG